MKLGRDDIEYLIDELSEKGYVVEPYSGRGMDGRMCVGVTLDNCPMLFRLGRDVEAELPSPSTDSMGRGIVAYWWSLEWPEGYQP